MKIFAISTKPSLNISLQSDGVFALAQFCDNENYVNFFRNRDKYYTCMIDNGAAENHRVSHEQLLKAARAVKADYIWCPDELFNKTETLVLTSEFLLSLSNKQKKTFKFLMIPQGKTLQQWISCYKAMIKMSECDGIILSKYSAPKCFSSSGNLVEGRRACIEYMVEKKLVDESLYYHLGGANEKILDEIKQCRWYSFIKSIDSNIFVKLAVHKKLLHGNTREPTERLDFDTELKEYQVQLALRNIKIAKAAMWSKFVTAK